jgi:hypothetical protein
MEPILKACDVFLLLSKEAKISMYRNPKLNSDFWEEFDSMANRLKVDPKELAAVINSESGFNPAAVNYVVDPKTGKHRLDNFGNKIPQAKGLNQLIKSTAKGLGIPDDIWNNFEKLPAVAQLPWVEKYFKGAGIAGLSRGQIYLKNFGGFSSQNPNGALYNSKEYMDAHPEMKFPNPSYQGTAYNQNKALDKTRKGYISKEDLTSLV